MAVPGTIGYHIATIIFAGGYERRTPNPLRITFVEVAAMVNRAAQQVVIGWSESLSVGALMNH